MRGKNREYDVSLPRDLLEFRVGRRVISELFPGPNNAQLRNEASCAARIFVARASALRELTLVFEELIKTGEASAGSFTRIERVAESAAMRRGKEGQGRAVANCFFSPFLMGRNWPHEERARPLT